MITKTNKSNSKYYRDLFNRVSDELMSHDSSSYNEVTFGSASAIIPCTLATVTEETYEDQRFYVKNDKGEFVLDSSNEFKADVEYYEADRITSLNQYFHYIDRIKEIKGGKYTRLPLDENLFEIDADKRSITVPPAFAQNGISVQKDEVAETLYFKIDRYYDATDLATQEVFIEWKNAAGEEGVSLPWVFDIESEPNYIIFGWPLSSRITGTAGQVQFAVRFYKLDEAADDRLVYSFSTLTQTATIKPGLAFDIAQILSQDRGAIDDATELISQRFTSSPLFGSNDVASKPIFLDMEILGFVGSRKSEDEEPSIYLNLTGDNFDQPIKLMTEAITEDAGQLSYSWKRKQLENNKTGNSIPYDKKPEFIYQLTADTAPVDGKTYYKKDETFAYVMFIPTIWKESDDPDNYVPIYERFSSVEVNSTGAYWVVARNRVGSASEEVQSATVIVPNPVPPVIEEGKNLPQSNVLANDKDNEIILTSNAKVPVTVENPSGEGVLSYQWSRSDSEDGEFAAIDGATEKTYEVLGLYDEELQKVETDENGRPLGDGYYKVNTKVYLNGEEKDLDSSVCRITHAASKPTVTCIPPEGVVIDGDLIEVELKDAQKEGLRVEVSFPDNCSENYDLREDLGDRITYQWYRYYAGNSDLPADRAKAALGNYKVNGDDELGDGRIRNPKADETETYEDDYILGDDSTYIQLGSQTAKFIPDEAGAIYFCEVTNTYNGTTAVRCSQFFNTTAF